MNKSKIFILFLCFALTACEKQAGKMQTKNYPVLYTEIKEISSHGVLLGGKFLTQGKSNIAEFGFLIEDEENSFAKKIVLEGIREEFEYLLNSDIPEGNNYHARAYAIAGPYTSYSNIVSFVSEGFETTSPEVISFNPAELTDGTHVTITGRHFSSIPENISITVNQLTCPLVYSNSDTIIFSTPVLPRGEYTFSLSVYEKKSSFGPLRVMNPQIDNYTPSEGFDCAEITIQGDFFGENTRVLFGSDEGSIIELGEDQLRVMSPLTLQTGPVDIAVDVSGKRSIAGQKFNILSHSVTSISATEAKVGDIIGIHGQEFVQNGRNSEVLFDGVPGRLIDISPTYLEVAFPLVEEAGNSLIVRNGVKEVYPEHTITYLKSWEELAAFPGTPMDDPVSESVGSMAYVGMGIDFRRGLGNPLSEWWMFDPSDNSWTRKSDFPGPPRYSSKSFVLNGIIYVLYGSAATFNPSFYFEIWAYDPASDTWSQKTSPPQVDRNYFLAGTGSYNGKGYVQVADVFLEYNPVLDSWTRLDFALWGEIDHSVIPFCFSLLGKSYWFFGDDTKLRLYDYRAAQNEWDFVMEIDNDFIVGRQDYAVFELGSKGYFGGGRRWDNANPAFGSFYEFDPEKLIIVEREAFHRPIARSAAFGIGNYGYVGLGIDEYQDPKKDFWKFDPSKP